MATMTPDKEEKRVWEKDDLRLKMDIGAWMAATGKALGDLAELMGLSRATMYARYRHPGNMSLNEVRRLYRVIGRVIRE